MSVCISIGAAAVMLGVCVNTIRAWHESGFLVPVYRTPGGHRRYDLVEITAVMRKHAPEKPRLTVAYARVSTHDQKKDLETQVERLKVECALKGWHDVEVLADLGSGMNYTKKGLRKLIGMLCRREIGRLVVMRQDRLLRFGAELVFELCRLCGCEVVVIEPIDHDPRKTIADDVLAILTVFSARCNGLRSHSNKRALAAAAVTIPA
jgi:predicted site-specific integrase-resolvase